MITTTRTRDTKGSRGQQSSACHPPKLRTVIVTAAALVAILGPMGHAEAGQESPPRTSNGPVGITRVPRWDARGLGQLPRQGIACLDVSADASQIAVG